MMAREANLLPQNWLFSMLGDLQRQKAAHYFDLIDQDNNGLIEPADFQRRADRLADAFDVSDEEEREELRQHLMRWWEHLSTLADADDDGCVTREEWNMYWKRFKIAVGMGSNSGSTGSLAAVARATFQAIDRSDSGKITEEELSGWLAAWDIEDHTFVFRQLDRDDKGYLTEEDLTEATKEFYLSNRVDAPGNVLYGRLSEPVEA